MDTNNTANTQKLEEEMSVLDWAKKKRKTISIVTIVICVALLAGLCWFFITSSNNKKSAEAIAQADIERYVNGNDSLAYDNYAKAASLSGKSAQRAKLEAAAICYDKGDYQTALNYLKSASVKSSIFEAGRFALMGDCYVNLKQYNDALKAFANGIKAADGNPEIVPVLLVKEANVYREIGDYDNEYKAYNRVISEFPVYAGTHTQVDLKMRAEAAKARAEAAQK